MPTQKGDGQTCMPSGQRLHHKTEPESKCSRCSVLHPTPFPGSALKWPAQSVQSLSQVFSSKRGGGGEAPVTTHARKRCRLGQPPTGVAAGEHLWNHVLHPSSTGRTQVPFLQAALLMCPCVWCFLPACVSLLTLSCFLRSSPESSS